MNLPHKIRHLNQPQSQETPIMSQNSQNRQILQELNRRQGEAAQKDIEVLRKVFNPSAKRSFNKTGFLNL